MKSSIFKILNIFKYSETVIRKKLEKSGKKEVSNQTRSLKKKVVNLSNIADAERSLQAPIGFGSKGNIYTFENYFRRMGEGGTESRL